MKNDHQLLPIKNDTKTIALIGPFVKAKSDNLGFWSYEWPDDTARIVSLWDGVKSKISTTTTMLYAAGCGIKDTSRAGFAEAVAAAMQADVVIISVGEARDMTGEAKSRALFNCPVCRKN